MHKAFDDLREWRSLSTFILCSIIQSVVLSKSKVLESIIHSLHITSTGDGIAFAMPISHMKGISLRQEVTFEEEISNLKKK